MFYALFGDQLCSRVGNVSFTYQFLSKPENINEVNKYISIINA